MRLKHTTFLSFCFHVFAFAATSLFSNKNNLSADVFPMNYEVEIQHHETETRVIKRRADVVPRAKSVTSDFLNSPSDLPANLPGNQPANLPGKPPANLVVNLSSDTLHPYLVGLRQKVYFKLNSISELDVSKGICITFLIDKSGSVRDVKVENNGAPVTKAENDSLAHQVNGNLRSAQNYKKIAAALMQINSLGDLPIEISENPIWVRLAINN
jgi:hypothetical protein